MPSSAPAAARPLMSAWVSLRHSGAQEVHGHTHEESRDPDRDRAAGPEERGHDQRGQHDLGAPGGLLGAQVVAGLAGRRIPDLAADFVVARVVPGDSLPALEIAVVGVADMLIGGGASLGGRQQLAQAKRGGHQDQAGGHVRFQPGFVRPPGPGQRQDRPPRILRRNPHLVQGTVRGLFSFWYFLLRFLDHFSFG